MGHRILSTVENMQLCNLMVAEYAVRGGTDLMFAKYAAKKLGFPISTGAVALRRPLLNLSPNVMVPATAARVAKESEEKLQALMKRLDALEKSVADVTRMTEEMMRIITTPGPNPNA